MSASIVWVGPKLVKRSATGYPLSATLAEEAVSPLSLCAKTRRAVVARHWSRSHVEILDLLGMSLDELPARWHPLAHQHVEGQIG